MPPKNIERCQLYVQTPEGYEPLATTESAEITSISFADSENAMDEFYIHLQAAINLTRSAIANIIQVLDGTIEPYEVNEMLRPRKKTKGELKKKEKSKMSVIISGMYVPERCSDCYLSVGYGCEIKGQIMTTKEMASKPDDCPVKSMDGLIDAIKTGEALRCKDTAGNIFTLNDHIFDIIKEYCEEED